jgi:hypothetical protein
MLLGEMVGGVRQAIVLDHAVGAEDKVPLRCHQPAAPVAEHVTVLADRDRRIGEQQVGPFEKADLRVMHVQEHDHRRGCLHVVGELAAEAELHPA